MPVCSGLYYAESKPSPKSLPREDAFQRPALILIHGAGGSHLSWPVELRRLPGYRVLALDLPGHGKSEGIAFQNVDSITSTVVSFLRDLGIFSVVMVGHSLGAAVAIRFTEKNPDQVKGLALISAAARFPIPSKLLNAASDPETYPIAISMINQYFFSPRTSSELKARIMRPLASQRSTLLYSDFLAASRVDFRTGPAINHCPCWVATGRQDLFTPVSMARAMTSTIGRAEVSEIPAAGHLLPLEQPVLVARGLQAFLSRHNHFHVAQGQKIVESGLPIVVQSNL